MKKKVITLLLATTMIAGSLAGCGSPSKTAETKAETEQATAGTEANTADTEVSTDAADTADASGQEKTFKILSIWAEDVDQGKMINDLTKRFQEEVNPNFNFEIELVSSDDLSTKIATLMASNDLPDAFAYVAGQPLTELIEADKVVNISEELEKLGASDAILEGTQTLLTGLSSSEDVYDLPLGLNIEGFWYNKAKFEEAGVEVPKTWDEFLTVCDKLKENGTQPLSAGGADKWPVSRLVNAYVVRSMGVDAVAEAMKGERSFTDEGFVAAAQMVSDMAEKGYFGEGVTTVDNTTAGNMVLSGEAAMCYNGSWFTQDITADTNPAGEDGIGYFSIPVVDEAISPATEIPMNCGNVLCLSKDKYDDATAEWLKFFVLNAGDYGVTEHGQLKGYQYSETAEVSPINQMVNDTIDSCTKSATWFEAMMNNETKSAAQDNVQTLANGEMTAEEYMQSIQDAYELSK